MVDKRVRNKIRAKRSVPIYKNPDFDCPFLLVKQSKDSLPTCSNPFLGAYNVKKQGGAMIINCPKYKSCKFYIKQVKNKKDLKIVKAYIKKYRKGKWLLVPYKHLDKLAESFSSKDSNYIERLFSFYGFMHFYDERVNEGMLLTCNIEYLRTQYFM